MEIGVSEIELQLGGVRSLKEKRKLIKSVIAKIQNKYNLSVAEVDYQDVWQSAVLGLAGISTEKSYLSRVLEKAVHIIEEDGNCVIVDYKIYFV